MPAVRGTVPSMLTAEALVGYITLYAEETAEAFPVTQIFGPLVAYSKANLKIKTQEIQAKLGAFHSRPSESRQSELERWSMLLVQSLYQAEKYDIPPDYAATTEIMEILSAQLGGDLSMVPNTIAGMADDAIRAMLEAVQKRVNVIRRTHEKLAIDMLTQSSFTVEVDGADQTVDWHGTTVTNASASWALAATRIDTDMATFVKTFRQAAGGSQELVLVPADFHEDYVVGNTQMIEYLKRFPEFARDKARLGPEFLLKDERFEVVRVEPQYIASYGGSRDYLWPSDKMVFGRAPNMTLQNATVRTPDNNNAGGLYARLNERMAAPRGAFVDVTFNAIPLILDPTQWMAFDLVP